MIKANVESFHVIGISVTTSNLNGQSANDIQALWGKFMSQGVLANIPNKLGEEIYCIYTNYTGDHTMPYDTILGARVSSLDEIPKGLAGMSFSGGVYNKYTCKGAMSEGIVYQAWDKIWKEELDRAYTADFEIYNAESTDPEKLEVDIYVALN